jgi:hypothetical protein
VFSDISRSVSATLVMDLLCGVRYTFRGDWGISSVYYDPSHPGEGCRHCDDGGGCIQEFLWGIPSGVIPVCTAGGEQRPWGIVSDGAGGAIVTWHDYRSGNWDTYAQHVLTSGAVDPAWPADGRALCTAANDQYAPTIVSDGVGGAIVTWMDYRSGNWDIYAQHVLASGAVDPAWPPGGRDLCTAANDQGTPCIVADGAGGAIVTWHDERSGTANLDIYAQHVLASGAVDPGWPAGGRALCTAANNQLYPQPVSDGAAGAIVTWWDYRSGTNYDIYAQHVLASGAVDPAWPPDGRALCTDANDQHMHSTVSDEAGGAIVAWRDLRSGAANYDIYAQHVLASGAVDPGWPADGRALCTAANGQDDPTIVSDGAGGAIVTWHDERSGTANLDIYAQHVLASGAVDPGWPANGRALCTARNGQAYPQIVSDDAGGAIVTWQDNRGTDSDVYAQHVLSSGVVDPLCPADGRELSLYDCTGTLPCITRDGAGGAVVAWRGQMALSTTGWDVYAARLRGPTPTDVLVALVSADATSERVRLEWSLGSAGGLSATVYRRTDQTAWTPMGTITADGTRHLAFIDHQVTSGTRYGYRLGVTVNGAETFAGETWVDVPAALAFALHGSQPNPNPGVLSVSFSLAAARPATLELLDVSGRRIISQEVGSLGTGTHVVKLAPELPLRSGVYLVRLTQDGRTLIAKAAVVK